MVKNGTKGIGYRLGVYGPDPDNDGIRWITKPRAPTAAVSQEFQEAVSENNRKVRGQPGVVCCLGIFPVPLKPRRKRKAP